jgi:hypothetical protein
MVKVEAYGSLTRRQEDLFRLGYYYKSLAAVTLLTSDDALTFKARAAQKVDGHVLASSSLKVMGSKVTFTPKRRTDGLQNYTLEYAANADLKMKGELKTKQTASSRTAESTVSVEYRQPTYALKLAVSDPNLGVRLTGTTEKDGRGIGADGIFDVALQRFVTYNLAAWATEARHSLVFKHNGSDKAAYSLGDFLFSYYNEVSTATRLGALVKYSYPRKETFIEFGGDYRYDEKTVMRGKVNSLGMLGLGMTRTLNQYLKIGLAAQFDVKKVKASNVSDYHFGLRLDFTT